MNEGMDPGFARVQMLLPWFPQLDLGPLPHVFWLQPQPVGKDFPGPPLAARALHIGPCRRCLWLVPSVSPVLTPLPPRGSGDGSGPCLAYWQPHQLQGPELPPSLEQWSPPFHPPRRCAPAGIPHHSQLGSTWWVLNLRWGHHLPRPACSSPTSTPRGSGSSAQAMECDYFSSQIILARRLGQPLPASLPS